MRVKHRQSYQVQVSTESDFSDIDMWDTGEVASSETSTTYAGTELLDGATYHIRAKVSASDFASGWATTSFRLNSTVALGNLTFNPEYNEFNVYTTVEFPTISSSPSADSESDNLSVKYILSTNSSFTNNIIINYDNGLNRNKTFLNDYSTSVWNMEISMKITG